MTQAERDSLMTLLEVLWAYGLTVLFVVAIVAIGVGMWRSR